MCVHSESRQRGTDPGAQAACPFIHSRTQGNSFRVGLATSTNLK